jgi:hypothetical protein
VIPDTSNSETIVLVELFPSISRNPVFPLETFFKVTFDRYSSFDVFVYNNPFDAGSQVQSEIVILSILAPFFSGYAPIIRMLSTALDPENCKFYNVKSNMGFTVAT